MTQNTVAPHTKKVYIPKRTVNSFQTSFILGIMRAKGYVATERILAIVTALSTATNFSDMTFDEARYLIVRLPNVSRQHLDAFEAGEATQQTIGLPRFNPHFKPANGKRNSKGGKA